MGTVDMIVERAQALGISGVAPVSPGRKGCLSFYTGKAPEVLEQSQSSLIITELPGDERVFQIREGDCPRLLFALAAPRVVEPGPPVIRQGRRVTVGRYTVLGGEGFGFVYYPGGNRWVRFPHYCGVYLEDGVTLGSHVAVDRGTLEDTFIGTDTHIDNLVHISHGVHIGAQCLVAAGAVIGGSTWIEQRVQIGLGAVIRDNLTIGEGACISMGAVVSQDVPPGGHVTGNLAMPHDRFMVWQKERCRDRL